MSEFIGTCVENPFESVETLGEVIDKAKNIGRTRFLEKVDVEEEDRKMMFQFPHDYDYFVYGNIYFFTHSMIEHFFEVSNENV